MELFPIILIKCNSVIVRIYLTIRAFWMDTMCVMCFIFILAEYHCAHLSKHIWTYKMPSFVHIKVVLPIEIWFINTIPKLKSLNLL